MRKLLKKLLIVLSIISAIFAIVALIDILRVGPAADLVAGAGVFAILGCWLFSLSNRITESTRPTDYPRIPELERVRYMKIRFQGGKYNDYIEPLHEVSPVFSKYTGKYSYFIDTCFMTMDGYTKTVVAMYDADNKPISIRPYSFEFIAADSGDCGFVEVW